MTHRGRVIRELGGSFDRVKPREIGRTFALHLKLSESPNASVLHIHLTQLAIAVKRLPVNLGNAVGWDVLLALAIGADFAEIDD
jgi:hypothetical protein